MKIKDHENENENWKWKRRWKWKWKCKRKWKWKIKTELKIFFNENAFFFGNFSFPFFFLRFLHFFLEIHEFLKRTPRRDQFQRFSTEKMPEEAPIQASDGLEDYFPGSACPRGSSAFPKNSDGDPDAKLAMESPTIEGYPSRYHMGLRFPQKRPYRYR